MTPKFDIVAGSRTKVSDLESGYHNVLAMKIINIYLYKSHTNYNLNIFMVKFNEICYNIDIGGNKNERRIYITWM